MAGRLLRNRSVRTLTASRPRRELGMSPDRCGTLSTTARARAHLTFGRSLPGRTSFSRNLIGRSNSPAASRLPVVGGPSAGSPVGRKRALEGFKRCGGQSGGVGACADSARPRPWAVTSQ